MHCNTLQVIYHFRAKRIIIAFTIITPIYLHFVIKTYEDIDVSADIDKTVKVR